MSADSNTLRLWVIYENPDDYPGKFVAREWRTSKGGAVAMQDPLAVVDSLSAARAAVLEANPGLVPLSRHADDDAKIVETWM